MGENFILLVFLKIVSLKTMSSYVLIAVFGAYYNATCFAWLARIFMEHGVIFQISKAVRVVWPGFRAMLIGFIPAAAMAMVVFHSLLEQRSLITVIMAIGALVSAILLHRHVINGVSNPTRWNLAIAIVVAVQLVFILILASKT